MKTITWVVITVFLMILFYSLYSGLLSFLFHLWMGFMVGTFVIIAIVVFMLIRFLRKL